MGGLIQHLEIYEKSNYIVCMSSARKKVFVAMSGGVDSSVAAFLLKEQGYDVAGVHMLCWDGCQNNNDKQDAMRVAAKLGIPFLVWDFRKEYKEAVFEYMVLGYMEGRTPNPDVMCNKEIKFGIFLKRALEAGADFIATGHYVRGGANHQSVRSAVDKSKDQSYFLWTLTQDQLKYCLFPIGDYLKSEVREIADRAGLATAKKKGSQGLCFVGKVDFADFLKGFIPKSEGDVVFADGTILGKHDGSQFYTIGQRHGLNIGGNPNPIYVAEKKMDTNTLVVAKNQNDPILYKQEIITENINWISGNQPSLFSNCLARIRYRQPLQEVSVSMPHASCLMLRFAVPQRAVSSGQSVVFYNKNDQMLGGGVIK